MNLNELRAGSYIRISVSNHRGVERYHIAKVTNFILDPIIKGDSKIQITAVYPKNETFTNISLSYETLKKLKARDVAWNSAEKLMKLIYA